MSSIINLTINLCILVIISVIIENIISGTKSEKYVKLVITCVVITVILNFLINLEFSEINNFETDDYKVDTNGIWDDTLKILSEETEKQMLLICKQNAVNVDSIKVDLETDYSDFKIKSVTISGMQAREAKNLIAGYFQISLAYINITEE